ncbi:MAG TPA: dTDP-4-dehydrorhamnose 3,5-epimerase family protein [Caldimonas sp.]|nr:dTDP-4-dehydrorhamnose 3,5-epimerase family protein [Caldimonas sp.]
MSQRLVVEDTPLAGLMRVRRQPIGDARGFLVRLFCADELRDAGWRAAVAQVNQTRTRERGSVRGMHYQRPPHAEMKLVQCLRGEVFDVAVDLRRGSPTFLRWHAERLSDDNGVALLIPEGFAHGLQTLTGDVDMLYCHSAAYVPTAEDGLHPRDPRLAIDWPLAIAALSRRDDAHAFVGTEFAGVEA